jgi:hypothetical protein
VADIRAPLFLQLPGLVTDPPVSAECPVCFALVLTPRLNDHKRVSHG